MSWSLTRSIPAWGKPCFVRAATSSAWVHSRGSASSSLALPFWKHDSRKQRDQKKKERKKKKRNKQKEKKEKKRKPVVSCHSMGGSARSQRHRQRYRRHESSSGNMKVGRYKIQNEKRKKKKECKRYLMSGYPLSVSKERDDFVLIFHSSSFVARGALSWLTQS